MKKQKKTREEKIAEDYFPVDKEDLKHTVEKEISKQEIAKGIVEKKYSKPEKTSLESVEKISKKFSPSKIKLKEKGYELIITEKPQAASKISSALGTPIKKDFRSVSYYELERNGKKIIVACAIGHLFTLKQNNSGKFPAFEIGWAPNYAVKKGDFTKKYYDTLLKLAKEAGSLTVATDYDIEGELIGMNVVRFICGQEDAGRMKFSTLTPRELAEAYEKKSKNINWGQAVAGETRHYLDWFYGINLSRALMNAIKTTGKFRIMSIGRVQGPTLNLIVRKERKILEFKPKPYWQIFITIQKNKNKLELKHIKDIFDKKELDKFKKLKGKKAVATTSKKEQVLPPNPPFNLTTLQTEAYKLHGITPINTLKTAQSLYLAGLISYPRTSSQKIPDSINYREILKKLAKKYRAENLITRKKPVEGKKTDPAHPSIYPTGQEQILSGDEEKIYNLIAKRFISVFCGNAVISNKTIKADTDRLVFSARGSSIKEKGWMETYPHKLTEKEIPDFEGEVEITDSRTEKKETQPPKRYSPASIISELEKKNLGTKATRATILETLYNRNYIKEQAIEATPLGMSLVSTLEKYSPIIIDEELTRNFEVDMNKIEDIYAKSPSKKLPIAERDIKKSSSGITDSKRSVLAEPDAEQSNIEPLLKKEQEIIDNAKETITGIAKDFEKNEKKIGKELIDANIKFREQQKTENQLMTCPECKKGKLGIAYSKKTKRFFVACNAYPECKNTFSLPPNGIIKKTDKVCEECGFPMLMRLSKGKRPWIFCWNPKCPTNAGWVKKKEGYKNK